MSDKSVAVKKAPVKKARKPKAPKIPPTKEELISALDARRDEIMSELGQLQSDQQIVNTLGLKQVPNLLIESIDDIQDELQELEDEKLAIEKRFYIGCEMPENTCSN